MSNINQYPLEAFQINDEDFYDVDYWNGVSYETHKISGATLKTLLGGAEALNDLTDVTTNLPLTPDNADDGKQLYFDVATGQWTTDDSVTFGTVVEDCKTSTLTGSIPKGTPVYLAGYDNDLLVVEEADASDPLKMPCIGITADVLDDTNAKKLMTFGKIQGLDTSADPEGTIYYVASGGGLTTTRPTGATDLIQRIAKVLKSAVSGGQLLVFNSSRTAGLPNLPTGMIWQGDINNEPQAVTLPSGVNIYNADGSLTGNRQVSGGSVYGLSYINLVNMLYQVEPPNGVTAWEIDVNASAMSGGDKVFKLFNNDLGVLKEWLSMTVNGRLTINEEYHLPIVDGTAGQVMTTDGAGVTTWQSAGGGSQDLADVIGVDANTGFVDVIVNTDLNPDGLWIMQTNNTDPTKQIALIFVDGGAGNDCIKIGQVNPADRLGGFGVWDPLANIQAFYLNATDSFAMQMTTNGIQFVASGVASGELLIANDLTFKIQAVGSALDVSLTMPVATADRSQTFQDKDGVIALLSDVQEKYIHQWYAYDMSPAAAYSWNGVTVGATAITTLNESYRAMEFVGTGGSDGCFVGGTLPTYYPASTSLKVTVNFSSDGTGGNIHFYIGFTKPDTVSGTYGDDTTTEWKFFTFVATAGLPTGANTFIFNGTGLLAQDPFSVKVFRDPSDPLDTYNGDAYLTNLLIETT
jgi:hypothetical protein